MRNVYFWRRKPNFGDELNWFLLKAFGAEDFQWAQPADAELVMIGSVLEHMPDAWTGTICGTGQLHPETRPNLRNARVLGLRGHMTMNRCVGLPGHTPIVLGDPGLLVSRVVRHPVAKYELGVVPHWSDTELHARYKYGHLIDPSGPPDQVVAEIARCKRIVSSSLHGLITADAFGIPRQAELHPRAIHEGGDFKYWDYASIYDDGPHFGEMWRAPWDIVQRTQDELQHIITVATGKQPPLAPIPEPEPKRHRRGKPPTISVLVPFRDDGEQRARVWGWLKRYWAEHLSSAEIIVGTDYRIPFNKAAAVNSAARRARGKVFVIMDADCYMDSLVVQRCSDNIVAALEAKKKLWYMPYSKLYRLNECTTMELIRTNPRSPFTFSTPPPAGDIETGNSAHYGHQYGALIQVMPAAAFKAVGGMDPRFNKGWGSEDAAFMQSLDTLYAPHQITPNDVLHLWHSKNGSNFSDRKWVGQKFNVANSRLAQRYSIATGERALMQGLVDERTAK